MKNRRIVTLTCAAATAVAVFVVPSAGAATVGEPNEGVCSFKVNDAERRYVDSLSRDVSLGVVADKARWATAFEQTFPEAADTVAEFQEMFTGSYVNYFNNNLEANADNWANRIADATGAGYEASREYFMQVWNSAATSDHQALNMSTYWSIVDQALSSGTITEPVRDGFEEFEIIPDRAELEAQRAQELPSMPKDKLSQYVAAYDSQDEVEQARRVAALMVAFEDARKVCQQGGGNALLPTDGPNPDTPTTTPTPYTPPPSQPGNSRDSVTKTYTEGTTRVTTTTQGNMTSVNVSVSKTTPKHQPASQETSGSSASTGVIIGVIVAILVAFGAAGAAFAMSDR